MRRSLLAALVVATFFTICGTSAASPVKAQDAVDPRAPVPARGAPEIATPPYPGYMYYSQLGAWLQALDRRSARMSVRQIGLSANGNPMWLVTITGPWPNATVKARNLKYRQLLMTDPARAKRMLTTTSGIRIPVYINASIHGSETTGVDAAVRLIKRLATARDRETLAWLSKTIVYINPCQNPDGRIVDQRQNGNGFDLNRDFITLTQPETRATVAQLRALRPTVLLDLHGFVNPMLIEPCTIPHNPSLEYDLIIKWALPLARAMKSSLEQNTGLTAQIPYLYGTAEDKLGEVNEGWDDYGPYYTGQIAQQMGALGYTLETPYKTLDGVDAHYWTCVGMLRYVVQHRWGIMRDQAEIFRRGDKGLLDGRPWQGNMTDMLRPVPWGDPSFPYSNVVGDVTFPWGYIVPVDGTLQRDTLQALKFVNHARSYGVEVHKATEPFSYEGTIYPAGTYVLRTRQPLRSLLNNMLWDGEDVKAKYGVSSMYDISAWSLPESWGFDCVPALTRVAASLARVTTRQTVAGTVSGDGPVYWFDGSTNQAVAVVNEMLQRLYNVGMVTEPVAPYVAIPDGAFLIDVTDTPGAREYISRAAKAYGIDFVDAGDVTLDDVARLSKPNIAVNVDNQTYWVLKNVLGFANVSNVASSPTVSNSNTLYVSSASSTALLSAVQNWLAGATLERQRTYVGINRGASQAWANGLLPGVTVASDPDTADNGIVFAHYDPDSEYTAGYPEDDFAFCYPPYWFTESSATIASDITYQPGVTGPFHSGFWNNPDEAAVGEAAMVSGRYDGPAATDYGRVVLMGFHPTFRAMEENTYLLIARAAFLSAATPPAP